MNGKSEYGQFLLVLAGAKMFEWLGELSTVGRGSQNGKNFEDTLVPTYSR